MKLGPCTVSAGAAGSRPRELAMSATITLLVLVAAGDLDDPATAALTRAAREALGPEAQIVVEPFQRPPGDAEALSLGRSALPSRRCCRSGSGRNLRSHPHRHRFSSRRRRRESKRHPAKLRRRPPL